MNYINTVEAAAQLGVHTNTIHRWVQNGTLKAYRVGRLLKFREDELNQLDLAVSIEPFWQVCGDSVVLGTRGLGERWRGLHYEILLSDLKADPERWVRQLRSKLWWRAGMTAELRRIAADGQQEVK